MVEDNLDAVRTLAALVADMGHLVEYAINGYAAIEIAGRFRPHFVLLDIAMPGMDGYEVCRRMKQDGNLAETRVVALTAYGGDEPRARSRAAGCELHLVKPVNAQTLFDILESTFPGSAAAR